MTKSLITIRTAALPGPTVAIIGGVHGNEPIGVRAIEAILPRLKLRRGQVIFIVANPPALAANRRYLDTNLNRALVSPPDRSSREGRLAEQLMPVLDDCDALLDLHASMNDDPPFAICEKDALSLAARLPVSIVSTGWTQTEPGSTDAYLHQRGRPAICVECGRLDRWRQNLPLAVETVNAFLAILGLVDQPMPPAREQTVVAVQYPVFKKTDRFRFVREFSGFETLQPNELIARDGKMQYRAPRTPSCIIFPWPEAPVGAEVFLIGRTSGGDLTTISGRLK